MTVAKKLIHRDGNHLTCPQIMDGAGLVSDLPAPPRVPFRFNAICYHFTALKDSVTLIVTCTQVNKLFPAINPDGWCGKQSSPVVTVVDERRWLGSGSTAFPFDQQGP